MTCLPQSGIAPCVSEAEFLERGNDLLHRILVVYERDRVERIEESRVTPEMELEESVQNLVVAYRGGVIGGVLNDVIDVCHDAAVSGTVCFVNKSKDAWSGEELLLKAHDESSEGRSSGSSDVGRRVVPGKGGGRRREAGWCPTPARSSALLDRFPESVADPLEGVEPGFAISVPYLHARRHRTGGPDENVPAPDEIEKRGRRKDAGNSELRCGERVEVGWRGAHALAPNVSVRRFANALFEVQESVE